MDPEPKSILRGLSLSLRHLLEGYFDGEDRWHPGDLERRLNEIGIWRDRDPKPIDELPHLSKEDLNARKVVDAYLQYRKEAGVSLEEAVEEFVRESAYTWANRFFALRCMEARNLINEVILQKEVYGWRSLQHKRLASKNPELCAGEDEGLFHVLFQEFERRAKELPHLFNARDPAAALHPSVAALKKSIALLSGREPVNGQEFSSDSTFEAPGAFGWMYQYWNTEEKDRVFEKVRIAKAKIEGVDIISATQIYTEAYMVKLLVQNSLGAIWMGMYPNSGLFRNWEYYVVDADRVPVKRKSVSEVTFLDPACGSGHFLLEAFDIFFDMYQEEGTLDTPRLICASILENNLFGIDIDERAVQISIVALWMKAKERASDLDSTDLSSFYDHLVATNIRLSKDKDHLEYFLKKHPEDRPLRVALESIFEGLTNVHELGSLVQIKEPVEEELLYIKNKLGAQRMLFGPATDEEMESWRQDIVTRLKEHFDAEAVSAVIAQSFFSRSAGKGLVLFDLLSRRYDVVAANPPYMRIGNTGDNVGRYLKSHYPLAKYDLYASFIMRCLELSNYDGYVAMITQQSWMYLRSFSRLRLNKAKLKKQEKSFPGLLAATTIESLVHIGPRGFSDISGEVVNSVMFVLKNRIPQQNHRIHAITIVDVEGVSEKSIELLKAISRDSTVNNSRKYRVFQRVLHTVPEAPVIYDAPEEIFKLFLLPKSLQDVAVVESGLKSGDNDRWVRNIWEVRDSSRWVRLLKGGRYSRWIQEIDSVVDWREEIQLHYRNDKIARVSGIDNYFKEGVSYNLINTNGLSGKHLAPGCIFNNATPTIFPKDKWYHAFICCAFNSILFRYLSFALNPTINFNVGDAKKLPMPATHQDTHIFKLIMEGCIATKGSKIQNIQKRINSIGEYFDNHHSLIMKQAVAKCLIEGLSNSLVYRIFNIPRSIKLQIDVAFQIPVAFKAIDGYNSAVDLPMCPTELRDQVASYLKNELDVQTLPRHELDNLKQRLRTLYEAEPRATMDIGFDPLIDNDETESIGARIPIPSETFLEELSIKLQVHPISIYWLLKEGIKHGIWRCRVEKQHITVDLFSAIILSLLGHRSLDESLGGKQVPDWADPDGIIPLVESFGEQTLLDRVRERIMIIFGVDSASSIEREFTEIMGKSLAKWLKRGFFEHHCKQFRKRPIAWQIESRPIDSFKHGSKVKRISGAAFKPAFSCIVYYHKLNADFLHKIRRQHVGPLRSRFEIELRTLENLQASSADQTERRLALEKSIEELKAFEDRLEEIINDGFDTTSLKEIVAQEPLDKWTSIEEKTPPPSNEELFYIQEKAYNPDLNDGVRVNIAPLQKAGLLAADVLSKKDCDRAIADRAIWRQDERRWCREEKLPQPGWWKTKGENI